MSRLDVRRVAIWGMGFSLTLMALALSTLLDPSLSDPITLALHVTGLVLMLYGVFGSSQ